MVEIIAKESSLEAPDVFPAGRVAITLRNEAKQVRNAQFYKLKEGVSLLQLTAARARSQEEAMNMVTFEGGPGAVGPGGVQVVVQDLPVGD